MIQAIRALWFLVSPQQLLYYMRCEVHGQQDCCFCYTVSITHSKLQLHGPFSLELTLTGTFLGSQVCYLHYRGQFWLWWPRNYQGGVCSTESHWMSLSMKVNVWAWKWQFEKLFFSRAFNLENQGSHSHPIILKLSRELQCAPLYTTPCYHMFCHAMASEQAPSADDDHEMWLKAPEKAGKWTWIFICLFLRKLV